MNQKVELLAPAGSFEAFLGALCAGADAVYLGGGKFGARAYADNFTTEEICRALHTAHLYGRKIYLTINTLTKDQEFPELLAYLDTLCSAGLDGVIVQDLGVLAFVRSHFKNLALHASTQMTITGVGGAAFLKEQGVSRIVPARELSLGEIKELKAATGLEIECFIHGAMCYSYSGQCLFSSILGGRSGNRGRCAQPCRLPYDIYADERALMKGVYPLSLKDMCTISDMPRLIEAGIDSFKIEGRMKKPEYAAGVTAIYRKYIDLYTCIQMQEENPDERSGQKGNVYAQNENEIQTTRYHVDEADLAQLKKLYIRSDIQTGYYDRHNGKEMVTLHKPGYTGSDETLLGNIRAQYIHEPEKLPVSMTAHLTKGEPARLTIMGETVSENGKKLSGTNNTLLTDKRTLSVTAEGSIVLPAEKSPLSEENVRRQLLKTGNSHLMVTECRVEMEEGCFLPVSALNDLRRQAVSDYENAVIARHRPDWDALKSDKSDNSHKADKGGNEVRSGLADSAEEPAGDVHKDCLVHTLEQLRAVLQHACRRIYVDSDFYLREQSAIEQQFSTSAKKQDSIGAELGGTELFLALPYILRKRDEPYLQKLTAAVLRAKEPVKGFLARNLESMGFISSLHGEYEIVPDAGFYCFNEEAAAFFSRFAKEFYLPYELNGKECGRLARKAGKYGMTASIIVYGTIPMMVTANCVGKTAGVCSMENPGNVPPDKKLTLHDRYRNVFPVEINCTHCYNVIYNSVPYSLHTSKTQLERIGSKVHRYDFIWETGREVSAILSKETFPFREYTACHIKRGVE